MKLISFLLGVGALFDGVVAFATPKPNLNPSQSVEQQQTERPYATAIFAGGCFWCMEPPFDKVNGVIDTVSGYIGGHVKDPTYAQVSAGTSGHYEAVQVVYDPRKVTYEQLLPIFWRNIDPLDPAGQFCDKGEQYLSAIFTTDKKQRQAAERSMQGLRLGGAMKGEIATQILPASEFYPAEAYHQDYYQKNPLRYRFYRSRCGRDARLSELWGNDSMTLSP